MSVTDSTSSSADARAALATLLRGCVRTGNIVLASGRTTDFYFDGREVTMNPQGLHLVSRLSYEALQGRCDAVGGPTAAAVPMVAGIGQYAHGQGAALRTFFTRKEAKEHGTGKRVEGPPLQQGDRVVVVDDTATSGGSLLQSIRAVREDTPATVDAALVIVDREEGAGEALASEGVELIPLFRRAELIGD